MTQKHDSMDSWQNRYKNQTRYPVTNSEATNPETTNPEFTFICHSSPSKMLKHFYNFILFSL
jgi:hypothetical protein